MIMTYDVIIKFSYFSKFYVNNITCSGIMKIFDEKWLTRNPEIENIPIWVLANSWRLGWVWDTIYGRSVSNNKLLNIAKCQVYSFYHFWLIKRKHELGLILSSVQLKWSLLTLKLIFLLSIYFETEKEHPSLSKLEKINGINL